MLDELRPYAKEKGLALKLNAAANIPHLTSDRELVRLIFINLVGNAIKFTQQGLAELQLDCIAGSHRLSVKDSGPGIPAHERVRIFEPFTMAGDLKQKHTPGIGLGLRLAREMATALGATSRSRPSLGKATVRKRANGYLVRAPCRNASCSI